MASNLKQCRQPLQLLRGERFNDSVHFSHLILILIVLIWFDSICCYSLWFVVSSITKAKSIDTNKVIIYYYHYYYYYWLNAAISLSHKLTFTQTCSRRYHQVQSYRKEFVSGRSEIYSHSERGWSDIQRVDRTMKGERELIQ